MKYRLFLRTTNATFTSCVFVKWFVFLIKIFLIRENVRRLFFVIFWLCVKIFYYIIKLKYCNYFKRKNKKNENCIFLKLLKNLKKKKKKIEKSMSKLISKSILNVFSMCIIVRHMKFNFQFHEITSNTQFVKCIHYFLKSRVTNIYI